MAYRRSRGRRGFGFRRRFRRRNATRLITESGARWERAHFNFGVTQVFETFQPTIDAIELVGSTSLTGALATADADLAPVGRLLQLPLRYYEVLGIVVDWHCVVSPMYQFQPAPNAFELPMQVGFTVFSQRMTNTGTPAGLPPYWLSQWPINQNSGITSASNEDIDYATRTHLQRTGLVFPSVFGVYEFESPPSGVTPGRPTWSGSTKLRLRRKLTDQYSLFIGLWNDRGNATEYDLQWFVTGSLWYRMRL